MALPPRHVAAVLSAVVVACAGAMSTITARPQAQQPLWRPPPRPVRPERAPVRRRPGGPKPKLIRLRNGAVLERDLIVEDVKNDTGALRAAGDGDVDRLVRLSRGGYEVRRVVDRNGATCLHRAAGNGHVAAVEYLLLAGCDATAAPATGKASKRGRTALHFAARGNHVACLDLLAKRGARLDAETGDGQTPLMWAAVYGAVNACEWLVSRGAATDRLHPKTGCGVAHWCGAGGDVATARFLHARGVDFGAPNHVGHTPLNKAAAKGHADLVEWILQHVDYDNVLLRDQTGRTAADAAADANFPHLARFLQERIALAEGRRRLSTAPRWLRPRRRAALP